MSYHGGRLMRIKTIPVIAVCIVLLSGCGAGTPDLSEVTQTTVGIGADGSVDEVSVESFDKDYYSKSGLTEFVSTQVDEFNSENGPGQSDDGESGELISVADISVDEQTKTARLELNYADTDVYNEFNETGIGFYSLSEAAGRDDVIAAGKLVKAGSDEKVSIGDIGNSSRLRVIYTDSAMRIQTSGKIRYYSASCVLIDDYTAETPDKPSVIIFR